MKMENELEKRNNFCAKCGALQGVSVDKTYFQVGNITIWQEFRWSCVCGKSAFFRPSDQFSIKAFDDDTRKILNKLGKKQTGRPPRIADNFDDDFEG